LDFPPGSIVSWIFLPFSGFSAPPALSAFSAAAFTIYYIPLYFYIYFSALCLPLDLPACLPFCRLHRIRFHSGFFLDSPFSGSFRIYSFHQIFVLPYGSVVGLGFLPGFTFCLPFTAATHLPHLYVHHSTVSLLLPAAPPFSPAAACTTCCRFLPLFTFRFMVYCAHKRRFLRVLVTPFFLPFCVPALPLRSTCLFRVPFLRLVLPRTCWVWSPFCLPGCVLLPYLPFVATGAVAGTPATPFTVLPSHLPGSLPPSAPCHLRLDFCCASSLHCRFLRLLLLLFYVLDTAVLLCRLRAKPRVPALAAIKTPLLRSGSFLTVSADRFRYCRSAFLPGSGSLPAWVPACRSLGYHRLRLEQTRCRCILPFSQCTYLPAACTVAPLPFRSGYCRLHLPLPASCAVLGASLRRYCYLPFWNFLQVDADYLRLRNVSSFLLSRFAIPRFRFFGTLLAAFRTCLLGAVTVLRFGYCLPYARAARDFGFCTCLTFHCYCLPGYVLGRSASAWVCLPIVTRCALLLLPLPFLPSGASCLLTLGAGFCLVPGTVSPACLLGACLPGSPFRFCLPFRLQLLERTLRRFPAAWCLSAACLPACAIMASPAFYRIDSAAFVALGSAAAAFSASLRFCRFAFCSLRFCLPAADYLRLPPCWVLPLVSAASCLLCCLPLTLYRLLQFCLLRLGFSYQRASFFRITLDSPPLSYAVFSAACLLPPGLHIPFVCHLHCFCLPACLRSCGRLRCRSAVACRSACCGFCRLPCLPALPLRSGFCLGLLHLTCASSLLLHRLPPALHSFLRCRFLLRTAGCRRLLSPYNLACLPRIRLRVSLPTSFALSAPFLSGRGFGASIRFLDAPPPPACLPRWILLRSLRTPRLHCVSACCARCS